MSDITDFVPELLAVETGSDYEMPPVGLWQGVCYSVIDLGTQKETFEGEAKDAHKVRIGFEFSAEVNAETGEEKVFTIHKEFTLSFGGRSKLRQFIDSWNGGETKMTNEEAKGFNVFSLLGKEVSLNIVEKTSKSSGKKYVDISSLSPRIKKIALHERQKENVYLLLTEKYFKAETFDSLPNFIQDKISSSPEYMKIYGVETLEEQEENMKKEAEEKAKQPATLADAQNVFGE